MKTEAEKKRDAYMVKLILREKSEFQYILPRDFQVIEEREKAVKVAIAFDFGCHTVQTFKEFWLPKSVIKFEFEHLAIKSWFFYQEGKFNGIHNFFDGHSGFLADLVKQQEQDEKLAQEAKELLTEKAKESNKKKEVRIQELVELVKVSEPRDRVQLMESKASLISAIKESYRLALFFKYQESGKAMNISYDDFKRNIG